MAVPSSSSEALSPLAANRSRNRRADSIAASSRCGQRSRQPSLLHAPQCRTTSHPVAPCRTDIPRPLLQWREDRSARARSPRQALQEQAQDSWELVTLEVSLAERSNPDLLSHRTGRQPQHHRCTRHQQVCHRPWSPRQRVPPSVRAATWRPNGVEMHRVDPRSNSVVGLDDVDPVRRSTAPAGSSGDRCSLNRVSSPAQNCDLRKSAPIARGIQPRDGAHGRSGSAYPQGR